VADVLATSGQQPDPAASPSLLEVASTFAAIESASGPARKATLLADLLARCDPRTARGVIRVISGELRIGLREGLVEAAIAQAFGRSLDEVKRAGMLTGDVGRTAELAQRGELGAAELALFHPLKFMLASPAEDAAEILTRLGPEVWVEDKYDGIRCQLHRVGSEVRLYSRDLHDISNQFPEVVAGARDLSWDGILDGEILAFREGTVLPFIALQSRLGRKEPHPALLAEVPVIYVAFDVLGLRRHGPGERSGNGIHGNGTASGADGPDDLDGAVAPMLEEPLSERRLALEHLGLPLAADGGAFALSHLTTAASIDALEAAFSEARARRNEGLMVKDPSSRYSPGRRGYGWLKMKKALATIDCVVVGVEVGHGKRHGVLSDYTFAVRDEANDVLVTIGKAYSGLTDAEIATMTRWFEDHTVSQHGRYRLVEPTVVVEVAFDVILRSNRHKSGFALRFPRIARLRLDKAASEADTLETVRELYEGLQHGAEHLVTAGARKAG
jgi:DNA ligase-1